MSRLLVLIVLILAGTIGGLASDPAPIRAISYFTGGCPSGWQDYEPASGRALLPVAADGGLARPVGGALAPGATLRHTHEGTAILNMEGSRLRQHPTNYGYIPMADLPQGPLRLNVAVEESSTGLPVVKLGACVKVEAAVGKAPPGMVMFFAGPDCPADWSPFSEANGRLLTGALPGDGSTGPFGSTLALRDGEDRQHSHLLRGPGELEKQVATVWSGCNTCIHRWANEDAEEYTGQARQVPSGLPYLQLQACSKDAPVGPQISKVAHGADFQVRALAVGQHASLFGQGMGPSEGVDAKLDENGGIVRERAGVQVMVDEVSAPLFFVRDDQINFQVPYEVTGRSSVQVAVVRDGVPGPEIELALEAAAPALFAWGDDPGRAIAVYADGSLNSAENPATPGQPVILFATGEGQTGPPGRTGVPAGAPYAAPLGDVELWIGGEQAVLDYAGAAPGYVGLMLCDRDDG